MKKFILLLALILAFTAFTRAQEDVPTTTEEDPDTIEDSGEDVTIDDEPTDETPAEEEPPVEEPPVEEPPVEEPTDDTDGEVPQEEQEEDVEGDRTGDLSFDWWEAEEGKTGFKFTLNVDSYLEPLDAATILCFETEDNYEIEEGAGAWGITFSCNAGVACQYNDWVSSYFASNEVNDADGDMIMWEEFNPADPFNKQRNYPAANKGLGMEPRGDGTNIMAHFAFDDDMYEETNLPEEGEESWYKCYATFNGNVHEELVSYSQSINTQGGEWTEMKLHVNEDGSVDDETDETDEPPVDEEEPPVDEEEPPVDEEEPPVDEEIEDEVDDTTDEVEDEVDDTADDVADEVDETADDVADEVDETAGDIEDAGDEAGEEIEDAGEEAGEEIEDAADTTGEEVEDAANDTGDAVEDAAEDTGDAVEDAAEDTGDAVEDAAEDVADAVSP